MDPDSPPGFCLKIKIIVNVKTFIPVLFCVSIVIFVQLNGFGKSKEVPYLRDGVSFSIAEGWKVIANDSIADGAYYFSAERTGTKTTGLITVTWANKEEDPDKAILAHQKSMKGSNIYRNPGIEFAMIVSDKLGGHDVRRCDYTTIAKRDLDCSKRPSIAGSKLNDGPDRKYS